MFKKVHMPPIRIWGLQTLIEIDNYQEINQWFKNINIELMRTF